MPVPDNQAVRLKKAGTTIEVENASLPIAGALETVVKNAAVAMNPLDCQRKDAGVSVQQ